MTDAGYIVAAYAICGGVLVGYTVRLQRRIKRAEATEPDPESPA